MSLRDTVRRGARGELVEELHQQLAAVGLPIQGDPAAVFGAATEETVRVFQRARNLQVDGICGRDTWSALFESQHSLGDRLLATRRPMLHGADVRDLQHRLNRLGFDPGRVDGIFGPNTESALRSFQRDAAIPCDGICGPATTLSLTQLGRLADGSIAGVKEQEAYAATPRPFEGRRIFLASRPASASFTTSVQNHLAALDAHVSLAVDLATDTDAVPAAHAFDADASILIQPVVDTAWRCAYYGSGRYESFRGSAIAHAVVASLRSVGEPNAAHPLAIGFLRETRMAAVVVQISDSLMSEAVAALVAAGIRAGFETPPAI